MACVKGAGLVGIVMACELFPAIYRTYAGTALELFWAAAWMFLALLAYLIRDWRHLQLAITLPGVLSIPFIWYGRILSISLISMFSKTEYNSSTASS